MRPSARWNVRWVSEPREKQAQAAVKQSVHRGRAGALLMRHVSQAPTLQHDSLNDTTLPRLEPQKFRQDTGLSSRFIGRLAAERIELIITQPEPLPPAWQRSLGPLAFAQAQGRSQLLCTGRSSEGCMQFLR